MIMINTAVVNYVLYINCCHRHWTLISRMFVLQFAFYYSLCQSSFCCCTKWTIVIVVHSVYSFLLPRIMVPANAFLCIFLSPSVFLSLLLFINLCLNWRFSLIYFYFISLGCHCLRISCFQCSCTNRPLLFMLTVAGHRHSGCKWCWGSQTGWWAAASDCCQLPKQCWTDEGDVYSVWVGQHQPAVCQSSVYSNTWSEGRPVCLHRVFQLCCLCARLRFCVTDVGN